MITSSLDHIVFAVDGFDGFDEVSNVIPTIGGKHEGKGTHNRLTSLENNIYLELISIDKSQSEIQAKDRMFKLDENNMKFPFLCRWFLRTNEIEKLHEQAKSMVSDLITITSISTGGRRLPNGEMLTWKAFSVTDNWQGVVPAVIQWTDSSSQEMNKNENSSYNVSKQHPSQTSASGLELVLPFRIYCAGKEKEMNRILNAFGLISETNKTVKVFEEKENENEKTRQNRLEATIKTSTKTFELFGNAEGQLLKEQKFTLPNFKIQHATKSDYQWITNAYKSIDFANSDFDRDFCVVGLINMKRIACARLVPVLSGSAEMGGVFVDEKFRNLGLARKMVEYLIETFKQQQQTNSSWSLYCLPFAHLSEFYQSFGFKEQPYDIDLTKFPIYIQNKMKQCEEKYGQKKVPLLILKSSDLSSNSKRKRED